MAPQPEKDAPLNVRARSTRAIVLCLAALALLTAADIWSKNWAIDALSAPLPAGVNPPVCVADQDGYTYLQRRRTEPLVVIPGHLQLRYAENCGAAFGMLDSAPRWVRASLFTVAALAATVVLLWMYARGSGGALFAWSVPLITSGAIGNLIDRWRFGYVIDFIRYHGWFEYPTFNVADITISVGVALLFLDGLRAPRQAQAAPANRAMHEA